MNILNEIIESSLFIGLAVLLVIGCVCIGVAIGCTANYRNHAWIEKYMRENNWDYMSDNSFMRGKAKVKIADLLAMKRRDIRKKYGNTEFEAP